MATLSFTASDLPSRCCLSWQPQDVAWAGSRLYPDLLVACGLVSLSLTLPLPCPGLGSSHIGTGPLGAPCPAAPSSRLVCSAGTEAHPVSNDHGPWSVKSPDLTSADRSAGQLLQQPGRAPCPAHGAPQLSLHCPLYTEDPGVRRQAACHSHSVQSLHPWALPGQGHNGHREPQVCISFHGDGLSHKPLVPGAR